MRTYSGLEVKLARMERDDIRIEDIAHSLANTCRFNGHVLRHYSVAQHSVLVSRAVPTRIALEGLMHDAEEAYTGDMVSELKHSGDQYSFCILGDHIQRMIFERFGLVNTEEVHKEIKAADNYIVDLEKKSLFRFSTSHIIDPLPAEQAEQEFLDRFILLFRLRHAA